MKSLRVRAAVSVAALGLLAGCGGPKRDVVDASNVPRLRAHAADALNGRPRMVPPHGPHSAFTTFRTTGGDGSRVIRTKWHGRKSGYTGDVWAWLPPQYSQAKYAKSGFPVLIALPGAWGYPSNYWAEATFALEERVAEWSQEGKTLPFILVMPVLNPRKTYYDGSDIPGQPKMGTWLTEDVPDFARANFRTYASRDGWAFMGSSSGGFAALKAVLKEPRKFKAAIVNGPDTAPDSPLWKGHPAEMLANDPRHLARQLTARGGPQVYLAFELGSKEDAVPDVKRFVDGYTDGDRGPIHSTLYEIPDGVHSGHTYIQRMPESLHWISEQMLGPVPSV
ncbi:alpha/beta hydrolase-fold protein [Streptomyces sp. CT34]|uniref:alpha/beta hydrolase n=1 Tax=Streptomyces sp. CT34 TaxID=1553907 RepID=UPI0005BD4C30|nr:alpha/beta hydrolase-fold protein [Streptomyces sp. CT34]